MRKAIVVVGPSGPLAAVATLASRAPCEALGGEALASAAVKRLSAARPVLDRWAAKVRWLARAGVAEVGTAEVEGAKDLWVAPVTLRFDLRRLAREAGDGDPARSPGHATLWALRELLRESAANECFSLRSARAGSEAVTARALLRAVSVVCREVGLVDGVVPRRFDERPASAPPPRREKPAPAPAPAPKRAKTPPAPPVEEPRPRRRAKKPPEDVSGFGGLPDDAVSEERVEAVELGPRGLPLDAEFFLDTAGIARWPCEVAALDASRRSLVHRLHPDRAGEGSARDFHRVVKGHGELLAWLAAHPDARPQPAPAPDPQPSAAVKARAPRKPRPPREPRAHTTSTSSVTAATSGEWPPRPEPPAPKPQPAKPAVDAKPERPRRARSEAKPSTAPAVPRAPEVVSSDAAYFARESGVSWPCEAGTLHEAWRSVAARLRRMTPASAAVEPYAKARRGYNDLLRSVGAA
ncbi:MAG: hypothetical protein R3A52_09850 [Polyangiales bacterium]